MQSFRPFLCAFQRDTVDGAIRTFHSRPNATTIRRFRHTTSPAPRLQPSTRPQPLHRRQQSLLAVEHSRYKSTAAKPLTEPPSKKSPHRAPPPKKDVPSYAMTFTCKKCSERSSHKISKQGYHEGTVLVTCPGCKNRHLIADHLKIFSDKRVTLEDILKDKGQAMKIGKVLQSEDGDVEIWSDGSKNPVAETGEKKN